MYSKAANARTLRRTIHLIRTLQPSTDDCVDDVFPLILSDFRTLNGKRCNKASLLLIYASSRQRMSFYKVLKQRRALRAFGRFGCFGLSEAD